MVLFADAHVHLYECYTLEAAFRSAFENLGRLADSAGRPGDSCLFGLMLAERKGCSFFRGLRDGSIHPGGGYAVGKSLENDAVVVTAGDGRKLLIFAGRQIVTGERLEVLALTSDAEIKDGGNIHEVIHQVISNGGIPVLPWSPGKWFGERGRIVGDLFEKFSPNQLLIGDTSMRPIGWGESLIMQRARAGGFKVAGGTDPFPFGGQEKIIGGYGITCEVDFDMNKPVSELRRLLVSPDVILSCVGRRNSLLEVLRRLLINALNNRK